MTQNIDAQENEHTEDAPTEAGTGKLSPKEFRLLQEVMEKKKKIKELEKTLDEKNAKVEELSREQESRKNNLEALENELSQIKRKQELSRIAAKLGAVGKSIDFYNGEIDEESFKSFIEQNPFFRAKPSALNFVNPTNPRIHGDSDGSITREQLRIAQKLGVTPEGYIKNVKFSKGEN